MLAGSRDGTTWRPGRQGAGVVKERQAMAIGQSRRVMLALAAAAAATGMMPSPTVAAEVGTATGDPLAQRIIGRFRQLPGRQAVEIWAPAAGDKPAFRAAYDADKALFCGSAF